MSWETTNKARLHALLNLDESIRHRWLAGMEESINRAMFSICVTHCIRTEFIAEHIILCVIYGSYWNRCYRNQKHSNLSAGEAKPLEAGGKANELNYESISWFGLLAPLCCSAALAAPQLKPHPKENKGIDANKA